MKKSDDVKSVPIAGLLEIFKDVTMFRVIAVKEKYLDQMFKVTDNMADAIKRLRAGHQIMGIANGYRIIGRFVDNGEFFNIHFATYLDVTRVENGDDQDRQRLIRATFPTIFVD